MTKATAVGRPIRRVDGVIKVTGDARYSSDVMLPGMLFAKCLRSPYASARIVSIDVSQALELPGVHAVLKGADVPDVRYGRFCRDVPVLTRDVVRFIGDKVAAVAADTAEIAEAAVALIEVEYEELPAVFDPLEAMLDSAPVLHPEKIEVSAEPTGPTQMYPPIPNVISHVQMHHGDAAQALASAPRVFEHSFTVPAVHQGYIEPHSSVVSVGDDGIVDVWIPNKGPHIASGEMADAIGLPKQKVRFNPIWLGGDFGGKGSLMDAVLGYYLALRTRRPVKTVMTYTEELTAGNPRHSAIVTLRTGIDDKARILGMEAKIVYNAGAYAGFVPVPMLGGYRELAGSYRVPAFAVEAFRVYTNRVPAGHMRSPGVPQVTFAVESHIDMIAHELSLDPLEMRRRNAITDGDLSPLGQQRHSVRCLDVIDAGARALGWDAPRAANVGRGVSLFESPPHDFGISTVTLTMGNDGRVAVQVGSPDTGTGFHTITAQLVAGRLGLDFADVTVTQGDTLSSGFEHGASGARLTITIGSAVADACGKMQQSLRSLAAERLNCAPDDIEIRPDGSFVASKSSIDLRTLMGWAGVHGKSPVVCTGKNTVDHHRDINCSAQFAEVEVDPDTGQVHVRRLVSAHEVASIVNPVTHQGQIEGGIIQSFGQAMTEHLQVEEGVVLTPHLGEYKMPTMMDIPELTTVLVESGNKDPFSTQPIGETSNVAVPAAIANAVFDAVGVRFTDLPISAEKIYQAISARANQ